MPAATPPPQTWQAHLEADGRGLVAVHSNGGEAVQGLEHISVEGVPGDRGKLLGDRDLRTGANFLVVEPGRGEGTAQSGVQQADGRGAQRGAGETSLQMGRSSQSGLLGHLFPTMLPPSGLPTQRCGPASMPAMANRLHLPVTLGQLGMAAPGLGAQAKSRFSRKWWGGGCQLVISDVCTGLGEWRPGCVCRLALLPDLGLILHFHPAG